MKYWEIIADNLSKAGWSWGGSAEGVSGGGGGGAGDFVDVRSSKYGHDVSRDVQSGFGCSEVGRKSAAAKRNGKIHIIQQP